jgi:hypothetical protein
MSNSFPIITFYNINDIGIIVDACIELCFQGVCEKSSLPAERLWKVIIQQITNSFGN